MARTTELVLLLCFFAYTTCYGIVPAEMHFSGPNIARGASVSQQPKDYCESSGIFHFAKSTCYGADLAIDGNNDTNFDHGSCSHTNPQSSQKATWKVTFRRLYYVTGILIFNRYPETYASRLFGFQVIGLTETNKQVIIYNDNLHRQYLQEIIRIQWAGGEKFASVVILLPRHNNAILTLCEVQIFAASCPTVNKPSNGDGNIVNNTGETGRHRNTAGTVVHFNCQGGYRLHGPAFIECLPSGNYNTTNTPTCVKTESECPKIVVKRPLYIAQDGGYTTGKHILFSCENGFILQGSETVTCLQNRRWNSDSPHCTKICSFPQDLDNGIFKIKMSQSCLTNDIHNLYVSCQVVPHCNEGYALTSSGIRTCLASGMWSELDSECKKKKCTLPELKKGYYTFLNQSNIEYNHVYYGTTVTFKCNNGYKSQKMYNRTCLANTLLSRDSPSCSPVVCSYSELQPVHNGFYVRDNGEHFTSGSLMYSQKVQIECTQGFKFSSGSRIRTCIAGGSFSGRNAVCEIISCPVLSSDQYIKYNPLFQAVSKVDYNTTVEVLCEKGIIVEGSRYKRCNESGLWEGDTVNCLSLCDTPTVENGILQYGNKTLPLLQQYQEGVSLHLSCNNGFKVQGRQMSFTCLKNHTWDRQPSCTVILETEEQKSNKNAVIGGVTSTVVLLFLAVIVLAVIFYQRRQKRLRRKLQSKRRFEDITNVNKDLGTGRNAFDNDYKYVRETSDTRHTYSNSLLQQPVVQPVGSCVSLHSDHAYYSFTSETKIPKTTIQLQDLSDIVLIGNHARENFEREFKNLPQGMSEAHSDALKLQNRGKNRYKNLYAYDETRVILEKDEESLSDYINACYVHGFNKTRKYIASQGPTKEVLDDFWKMVWQEDCSKIVMLTKLIEEGKTKCEKYWPDEGSVTYGRITVTMQSTESFSQFMIRTFTIKKDHLHSKTVNQFHFTAWPDKGVPRYASSLVQFLAKVKYAPAEGTGPIVVHCSAGVGRTGTFIALDNLTEQGNEMGYVDVAGMVASLRRQRVSLVQTLEQYIFVHHALVESLMLSTSALSAAKFPAAFGELLQMDNKKKKTKIRVEFETLKKMSPVADECQYVSSKQIRNRQKNRYSNVLPVDEFMPALSTSDGSVGTSYINAVFLPSYKEQRAFIITQAPLESTKEDFWRLVWEHDVYTIVMMNNTQDILGQEVYWPNERERAAFGNIIVTNDGSEQINSHLVMSLTITKHLVTRYIKIFQCVGWQSRKSLPDSPEVILSLMEIVQVWQQQTGNHTNIVHCLNGADKSGLFCVVSAVIERMKIEQDVAISQVIEHMRNAREQVIPSIEQYQFCHESVLAFMRQYDTYSNFSS